MQSAAQGHGQAVWHCWMWQGGLWGGLSDPRNFAHLCRALALPSGKIRKAVLGKQGREERDLKRQCLVWEKPMGSLTRSGGSPGTAGPAEGVGVGAGVCWPRGSCARTSPQEGSWGVYAAARRWLPSLTDPFCFSFKCLQALNV